MAPERSKETPRLTLVRRVADLETRLATLEAHRRDGAAALHMPQVPIDRGALAAVLGVHPDTISDFAREGMPVIARGGRGVRAVYDLSACVTWWRTHKTISTATRAYDRRLSSKDRKS